VWEFPFGDTLQSTCFHHPPSFPPSCPVRQGFICCTSQPVVTSSKHADIEVISQWDILRTPAAAKGMNRPSAKGAALLIDSSDALLVESGARPDQWPPISRRSRPKSRTGNRDSHVLPGRFACQEPIESPVSQGREGVAAIGKGEKNDGTHPVLAQDCKDRLIALEHEIFIHIRRDERPAVSAIGS